MYVNYNLRTYVWYIGIIFVAEAPGVRGANSPLRQAQVRGSLWFGIWVWYYYYLIFIEGIMGGFFTNIFFRGWLRGIFFYFIFFVQSNSLFIFFYIFFLGIK